ncbi:hypothetical protein J7E63_15825 [Bacillus sp. ISL-75]|uniref:hypothetical protein n=1 Tax=Bacillus sp. ISL-75 TaxID=2819137 RepID=UPI001BEC6716|nr:hypothetical protein [Bacillus sp. ISL-75]MBT2728398.1 hypothetical protein [Bacillus sp. ISL-75]
MEKTITIDGKQIRFKSNGATPLRYKAQFGKDYLKEILKMSPLQDLAKKKKTDVKDLEVLDFEVFYNISWIMAKTADPTIAEPIEWLSQFEEFPIDEIFPEMQELMLASISSSKKKL